MTPSGGNQSSVLQPLQHPLFRALLVASMISNIGTWMQEVGEGWLMVTLTTSPTLIGLLETAMTLPIFLLALPGGALADIFDRRRVLLATQIWMALVALLMSVLTLSGVMTPMLLLVLTFTLSIGAAVNQPAWQAIIPELVSKDHLPAAIALGSVAFNIARAIGPAIGGVIIAASGPWAVFLLNALSFLTVIVVLYRWKREHHDTVLPTERMVGAMRAGIRFVRHEPRLQAVLLRTVMFILFASSMWATLPFIARHEMGVSSFQFGLFMASLGVGAVLGAVVMERLRRKISVDMMVRCATVGFAGHLFVLGHVRLLGMLLLSMFCGGIAWMILMSSLNTAAQIASPAWVRARAMSVYILVFMGGFALGSAAWGFISTHAGVSTSLTIAAIGAAGTAVIGRRYALYADAKIDLSPSMHWSQPVLAIEPHYEQGPVMVTVEYRVNQEDAKNFSRAIHALSRIRRRDGAVQWGIYQDVADLGRYVEIFVVESWVEHLRQHKRVTVNDRSAEERVHSYHRGPDTPLVHHFIYSEER